MVAELSPGFEAAVKRLDDAIRRDKVRPCCVHACGNGNPTIRFYEADGTTTSLQYINGEWAVMYPIDGRRYGDA